MSTWAFHQQTSCRRHYRIHRSNSGPRIMSLIVVSQRTRNHPRRLDALDRLSQDRVDLEICLQHLRRMWTTHLCHSPPNLGRLCRGLTTINRTTNLKLFQAIIMYTYKGGIFIIVPVSGTSVGLIIRRICSMPCKSGLSPPWQQKIFSSIIAAIGKQLKQSVNVFHNFMLKRLLPKMEDFLLIFFNFQHFQFY